MSNDRRRRRSEKTHEAVYYQLDHVRQKHGLGFLVLANDEGVFVAGAGEKDRDEVFAAYAAEMAQADSAYRQKLEAELHEYLFGPDADTVVDVRSFKIDDMPMYLCAAGAASSSSDDALEHTINGVQRIFRTT
ncbi:hypothetical protein FIV42_08770 [Persicimonas caeni]|uniref:Roadblock/LC7 domain-containing protein n=1 Tax=Persicimonas caeni TaxID=2292766 RepID=A0A4Y6PRG2_PERCE|nr:hypothetical protein [Persicimonas caeni]QDG50820.1 hypothetical protein FIV42_08770 [Persicimonas caeni]QED32041.1 hypothetical protein FRD00_08765 [Persicimonas caeni]